MSKKSTKINITNLTINLHGEGNESLRDSIFQKILHRTPFDEEEEELFAPPLAMVRESIANRIAKYVTAVDTIEGNPSVPAEDLGIQDGVSKEEVTTLFKARIADLEELLETIDQLIAKDAKRFEEFSIAATDTN